VDLTAANTHTEDPVPFQPPTAAPAAGAIRGQPYGLSSASATVDLPASPVFDLLWHPQQHEVDVSTGTPVLVPRLRELRADPGVCGVDARGAMALALADADAHGWRRLDPILSCPAEYTPDGDPGYVRVYRVPRGVAHLVAFATLVQSPVGVRLRRDDARWVRWLRYLYESGQVWEPDAAYKAELLAQLRQRHEGRLAKTSDETRRKAISEGAAASIAAAEAAFADAPAPAPASRSRRAPAPVLGGDHE
jgi:hypothetical protein